MVSSLYLPPLPSPRQEGSGENDASALTPDVLSCNEYRTFWISWLSRYLEVGRYHRHGYHELVRLEPIMAQTVGAISVTTDGHEGDWEFENEAGRIYIFF